MAHVYRGKLGNEKESKKRWEATGLDGGTRKRVVILLDIVMRWPIDRQLHHRHHDYDWNHSTYP